MSALLPYANLGTGTRREITAKFKELADGAFSQRRYRDAGRLYLTVVSGIVPSWKDVPLQATVGGGGPSQWTAYAFLESEVRLLLSGCYTGIASCYLQTGDVEQALLWCEEAAFLAKTLRYALSETHFDWFACDSEEDLASYHLERVRTYSQASNIYEILGNTGKATERRLLTSAGLDSIELRDVAPEILQACDALKLLELISLLLGSWKKLAIKQKGLMKARVGFSSFIWKSRLYIGGGSLTLHFGPYYRDLAYLDLEKMDTWHFLPRLPADARETGEWINWTFAIRDDKAYLFNGRDRVHFFDLGQETWGSALTSGLSSCLREIQEPNSQRITYQNIGHTTQQVVGDRLYVFGGSHERCVTGCNIFLQLNLKTFEWRRLSGTLTPGSISDYSCPGPRVSACSWVDDEEQRLYIFGGQCDLAAGLRAGEPHGRQQAHAYRDFWSWDLKNEQWRMERLFGNVPCGRSNAASTYNQTIGSNIIFSGINSNLSSRFGQVIFSCAYLADTFMYIPGPPDPLTGKRKTGKWKQVLTRGFPTYRQKATLLTDQGTGKMYLYGGYPERAIHTFTDLWTLRVDVPSGHFEEVNVDEEGKSARVGPWQRCFACCSIGNWKKCGGSCKGKAFFCDADCLRNGWKDHKAMHHCQKV
ncbi:hypothetical protein BDZ97DRAFT_1811485 [Flammula alnicola]|nr:hypothetical protein BDZ97DRAFT_1811485 [Flammula alnicola]